MPRARELLAIAVRRSTWRRCVYLGIAAAHRLLELELTNPIDGTRPGARAAVAARTAFASGS